MKITLDVDGVLADVIKSWLNYIVIQLDLKSLNTILLIGIFGRTIKSIVLISMLN